MYHFLVDVIRGIRRSPLESPTDATSILEGGRPSLMRPLSITDEHRAEYATFLSSTSLGQHLAPILQHEVAPTTVVFDAASSPPLPASDPALEVRLYGSLRGALQPRTRSTVERAMPAQWAAVADEGASLSLASVGGREVVPFLLVAFLVRRWDSFIKGWTESHVEGCTSHVSRHHNGDSVIYPIAAMTAVVEVYGDPVRRHLGELGIMRHCITLLQVLWRSLSIPPPAAVECSQEQRNAWHRSQTQVWSLLAALLTFIEVFLDVEEEKPTAVGSDLTSYGLAFVRRTGLSNHSLLYGLHSSGGSEVSRSASSVPLGSVSETDLIHILPSLLLTASKGVLASFREPEAYDDDAAENLAEKSYLTSSEEFGAGVLGDTTVCICRVMRWLYTQEETSNADDVAGPLLGALSILLARLIACYRENQRKGTTDMVSLRLLLGQLSCGLQLLTVLLQRDTVVALSAMDHAFFFDALITTLQIVGRCCGEAIPPTTTSALDLATLWLVNTADGSPDHRVMFSVDRDAVQRGVPEAHSAPPLPHVSTLLERISDDEVADEFLFTYLGLLAASYTVRSSAAYDTLDARSCRTLDQLDVTILKVFLTAYGDGDTDARMEVSGAPNDMISTFGDSTDADTPLLAEVPVDKEVEPAFAENSCIYNLLVRHVVWCSDASLPSSRLGEPRLTSDLALEHHNCCSFLVDHGFFRVVLLKEHFRAFFIGRKDEYGVRTAAILSFTAHCLLSHSRLSRLPQGKKADSVVTTSVDSVLHLFTAWLRSAEGHRGAMTLQYYSSALVHLAAILATALLDDGKEGASSAVCEAVLQCGGVEILIHVAQRCVRDPSFIRCSPKDHCARKDHAICCFIHWIQTGLIALSRHAVARVYMSECCGKLILGFVWEPSLRSTGETLLEQLLRQSSCDAVLHAAPSTSAPGNRVTEAVDGVPSHIRSLARDCCQVLLFCGSDVRGHGDGREMIERVSGAAMLHAGDEGSLMSLSLSLVDTETERDAAFVALLSVLCRAFAALRDSPSERLAQWTELLPLRRLQRAIHIAGVDCGVDIFSLLLHRLSQPSTDAAVPLIVELLMRLVQSNPSQRDLFLRTVTPCALLENLLPTSLVSCATTWATAVEWSLWIVFEERLPSPLVELDAEGWGNMSTLLALQLNLQNSDVLTALLKQFQTNLKDVHQRASLRLLLACVSSAIRQSQANLYIAASTTVHDAVGQLLPFTVSYPDLRADIVEILVQLNSHHVDVRQLKQLLKLIIDCRQLSDRQSLVPVVVDVLSKSTAAYQSQQRAPSHYLAFHQGAGPVGFRAGLPEFPLDGYSVSLVVRWESDVDGANAPRRGTSCLFSLRTTDKQTLFALMVDHRTGQLFVQQQNLQKQEVRVETKVRLPRQTWVHVTVLHRPAAFLNVFAGGQLQLSLDGGDLSLVPQVVYPLMSRGYLYAGCLGHEVDRVCVTHSFYGQTSAVYFFPFILSPREIQVLCATDDESQVPIPRSTATSSGSGSTTHVVSGAGMGVGAVRVEQALAERAIVSVDTRLSDKGSLYNLSAVLRGRGRESRLVTFEGTLICGTQHILNTMGVLGPLSAVIFPLLTLLVNPTLPIDAQGLKKTPALSESDAAVIAAADSTTADTLISVLGLVRSLMQVETVRVEMADSGLFVFLGQVLQLLGPQLTLHVASSLSQVLEESFTYPRLFEPVFTALFLTTDSLHAAPQTVQQLWINTQRSFLQMHLNALPSLRAMGTQAVIVSELLQIASGPPLREEGEDEKGGREDIATASGRHDTLLASTTAAAELPLQIDRVRMSRKELEDQWMSYLEALTVTPITLSDAQALQHLVDGLRRSGRNEAIQLRLMNRIRLLIVSSDAVLAQFLGRNMYAISLVLYLTSSVHESVRLEALLQLLFLISRSKRTQELMNPVLLSKGIEVVHVAEEVSLTWLKEMLRGCSVDVSLYLVLRCGMIGHFDIPTVPTEYTPLDSTCQLRFAAVLLPTLMLLKRSCHVSLKTLALTDIAVLLRQDTSAWRRLIAVRGWYVSIITFFFALPLTEFPSHVDDEGASPTVDGPPTPGTSSPASFQRSGGEGEEVLPFITTSAILSYTLFQALLCEPYGARELDLVVAYLREQRLHQLLHHVLCSIADRYRGRFRGPAMDSVSGTEVDSHVGANLFGGLGRSCAFFNFCSFVSNVEKVLFYSAPRSPLPGIPSARSTSNVWRSSSPPPSTLGNSSPKVSYTEWDEMVLVADVAVSPSPKANSCEGVKEAEGPTAIPAFLGSPYCRCYYTVEVDDTQGEARRQVLRRPDGRWLHLPLALKCAELLCSNAFFLQAGSSTGGGTTGSGTGIGSGSVGPVDALFTSPAPPWPISRGGHLRFFARLFRVSCQMTLRSAWSLDSALLLVDHFIQRVDRGASSGPLGLLKRAVSPAEGPREHTPLAAAMVLLHSLHSLLLRRLQSSENGGSVHHRNFNVQLVDRLKALVEAFHQPFDQLIGRQPSVHVSPLGAVSPSLHVERGRESQPSPINENTGEVHTGHLTTLQWLRDRSANPRQTVEAFAEIASRPDYSSFMERCLLTVEREQLTEKSLMAEVASELGDGLRRLQDLFLENSMSRKLVQDKIRTLMKEYDIRDGFLRGTSHEKEGGDIHSSYDTVLFPGATNKVLAATRSAAWGRFIASLKGTLWNLDPAGGQNTTQYVKLSLQEQQPLVHRKLVLDRDGTNHQNVATTTATLASAGSRAGETGAAKNEEGLSPLKTDRLRLRGGEALLLEQLDDDDAIADDAPVISAAATLAASTLTDLGNPGMFSSAHDEAELSLHQLLHQQTTEAREPVGDERTVECPPSLFSIPCEVPYMMHCWSAIFTVRGSEVFVVMDDVNKAYHQTVADDAKPFLLRPRTFNFQLHHVELLAPGRRFRMRRTAIELWTRDRRSYFINFADANAMYSALQSLRVAASWKQTLTPPSFLRSASDALGVGSPLFLLQGARTGATHKVYVCHENPRREPLRLRAMTQWRSRNLTNLDYLLILNLLAGRTVNDMTQYPVVPWVVVDYSSTELDLTKSETFRDLTQPIGACGSSERRALVQQRYSEMKEIGDVPSHYFTHYSSPAVTLYFLARLEPYTTLNILLQGGHFDHADRMFHSIHASYRAVTTSTQDVRELVPELYYLPELCMNANKVEFGRKQDGTAMDDLQLPPWAHNCPYEFVYRMRSALESEHVSANLHHWIDLVFGFKQRGKEAIAALNVFNWHSYEELEKNRQAGAVDHQLLIDSLDNIGQTPIQLFRHPHQPRQLQEWADPLALPINVKLLPLRWGCVRVARVVVLDTDRVMVVAGSGAAASLKMRLSLIRSCECTATATFPSLPSPLLPSSKPTASTPLTHQLPVVDEPTRMTPLLAPVVSPVRSSTAPPLVRHPADSYSFDIAEEYDRRIPPMPPGVIPNNTTFVDGSCAESDTVLLSYSAEVFIALGGMFDHSVVIRPLSGATDEVRLRAHCGRVRLLASSTDSRYIVTGSEDTTFVVWSCCLPPGRQRLEVDLLFTIYGHEDLPSAVDVSNTLDLVATASSDGTLMLHSISTGSLERVIRHPKGFPIHRVLIQSSCYVPNIVFVSNTDDVVHQMSINGASLRSFAPPGRITAWTAAPGQLLLLACQPLGNETRRHIVRTADEKEHTAPVMDHPSASVVYLQSFFLEPLKVVPLATEYVIHTLSCHPNHAQVVVAGTDTGKLLLFRTSPPGC